MDDLEIQIRPYERHGVHSWIWRIVAAETAELVDAEEETDCNFTPEEATMAATVRLNELRGNAWRTVPPTKDTL